MGTVGEAALTHGALLLSVVGRRRFAPLSFNTTAATEGVLGLLSLLFLTLIWEPALGGGEKGSAPDPKHCCTTTKHPGWQQEHLCDPDTQKPGAGSDIPPSPLFCHYLSPLWIELSALKSIKNTDEKFCSALYI